MSSILFAAAGAAGFAILFGIEKKWLWIIALSSGIAWGGYLLLCRWFPKDSMAMFLITVFIVIVSGGLSVFVKCPVILFSTPVLIPFIPGAALYYVMYDIVSRSSLLSRDFQILVSQSGAMAMGILVAELILLLCGSLRKMRKRGHRRGFEKMETQGEKMLAIREKVW